MTVQKTCPHLGIYRVSTRGLYLVAALIVLAACAPETWSGERPEVVARVNGESISRSELQRALSASAGSLKIEQDPGVKTPDGKEAEHLALRKLIHQRLILQEAARRGLTVTEKEFDEALAGLRRSFKDLKDFGLWMESRGLDDKSLFEAIRNDLLATRVRVILVEGVRLTDEELQGYYKTHKEDLVIGEEVRLRIIALKDKKTSEEIMEALRKGDTFSRLARKWSRGIRAAQGGDTGWIDARTLQPPLRGAVGELKPGEVAGPLQKGPEEFLIVGLEGRRPLKAKSLDEARPEIERRLLPSKLHKIFQAWLAEQENNAKIEVFP